MFKPNKNKTLQEKYDLCTELIETLTLTEEHCKIIRNVQNNRPLISHTERSSFEAVADNSGYW